MTTLYSMVNETENRIDSRDVQIPVSASALDRPEFDHHFYHHLLRQKAAHKH